MKIFEIRETGLPDVGSEFMDYAKLALIMLASVPTSGLTFEEMANRLDLRKKLKEAKPGDNIELNDQEIGSLISCARTMRWLVVSDEIVAFGDYVEFLATGKAAEHPYIAPVREVNETADAAE